MSKIKLNDLELKTFTEQDALDYCQLNSINFDDITELDLSFNELTDITGIKLFKNLKVLRLEYNNKQIDISVLKNLTELILLDINNNQIIDISVIQYLKNLKNLNISCNKLTDISAVKDLKKLEILDIDYLKLESDQIKYIKFLKNLKELWCNKGFKDMNILNQLNKNIKIIK